MTSPILLLFLLCVVCRWGTTGRGGGGGECASGGWEDVMLGFVDDNCCEGGADITSFSTSRLLSGEVAAGGGGDPILPSLGARGEDR